MILAFGGAGRLVESSAEAARVKAAAIAIVASEVAMQRLRQVFLVMSSSDAECEKAGSFYI